MPRFVVDLGDVQLSEAEHSAIAGAIHSAVIGQLAKVSDAGAHHATKTLTRAGMGFGPPPDGPSAKPTKPAKPAKATTEKPAKPAKATTEKPAKPEKPRKR